MRRQYFLGILIVGVLSVLGYKGWTLINTAAPQTTIPATVTSTPNAGIESTATPATDDTKTNAIDAETPPSSTALTHTIVFAADFSTNGGCADHSDSDDCDLFTATLDLSNGSVSNITQITNTPGVSESYPVWNPNGAYAYASVFQNAKKKYIETVSITNHTASTLLTNATWPEVKPDGSSLLYVASDTNLLMTAPLLSSGTTIGSSARVTNESNQQDPDYSPNGKLIVFHQTGNGGAVGTVYDTTSGTSTRYADTTGHCAFAPDGITTICDKSKGGGLFERTYSQGTLGNESEIIHDQSAATLAQYDPAFATCSGTSFNYPTFCSDNNHILVSASCSTSPTTVSFSRLFLLDLTGAAPIYQPIGKALADTFGGAGKSSWTVDCLSQ
jgi:hypothetical protein